LSINTAEGDHDSEQSWLVEAVASVLTIYPSIKSERELGKEQENSSATEEALPEKDIPVAEENLNDGGGQDATRPRRGKAK